MPVTELTTAEYLSRLCIFKVADLLKSKKRVERSSAGHECIQGLRKSAPVSWQLGGILLYPALTGTFISGTQA